MLDWSSSNWCIVCGVRYDVELVLPLMWSSASTSGVRGKLTDTVLKDDTLSFSFKEVSSAAISCSFKASCSRMISFSRLLMDRSDVLTLREGSDIDSFGWEREWEWKCVCVYGDEDE